MIDKEMIASELGLLKIMLKQYENQKSYSQSAALKCAINIIELYLADKLVEQREEVKNDT